eukprot:15102365-Alexandrium_andersonii.AAC.1
MLYHSVARMCAPRGGGWKPRWDWTRVNVRADVFESGSPASGQGACVTTAGIPKLLVASDGAS